MTKRDEHTFQFRSYKISQAAAAEADYHEERQTHWQARAAAALEIVKDTIGAKVVEHQVTQGSQVSVEVDFGDPTAWREYQLAFGKIKAHREAAETYRTNERVYNTQGDRSYELDTSDVQFFRLGGQSRED